MVGTGDFPATIAYTRYALQRHFLDDLLDLHIALAPDVLDYAMIWLTQAQDPLARNDENPYANWTDMYAVWRTRTSPVPPLPLSL